MWHKWAKDNGVDRSSAQAVHPSLSLAVGIVRVGWIKLHWLAGSGNSGSDSIGYMLLPSANPF